jgi:hypothetical protein
MIAGSFNLKYALAAGTVSIVSANDWVRCRTKQKPSENHAASQEKNVRGISSINLNVPNGKRTVSHRG